jgi:sulfate adenylyltransferase subunit 1 (EFTu-like GTPase family)
MATCEIESGEVSVGDRLLVYPGGREFLVKSIYRDRDTPLDRCAEGTVIILFAQIGEKSDGGDLVAGEKLVANPTSYVP